MSRASNPNHNVEVSGSIHVHAKEASSFFMLASPPPEKSVAHPVSTDLLTEIWNNAKIHLIFGCQVPHGSGMIAVNTRD